MGQDATWILADSWGEALLLRLSPDSEAAAWSASSTIPPTSPTSPANGSQLQGRRPRRTSSGRMQPPLPLKLTVESVARGRFSSPTALLDLGGGFIFVGSHYGDSLLVRITYPSRSQEPLPSTPKVAAMDIDGTSEPEGVSIDIINTYTNLGPIVDFCVVETDAGQGPVSCQQTFTRIYRSDESGVVESSCSVLGRQDRWQPSNRTSWCRHC